MWISVMNRLTFDRLLLTKHTFLGLVFLVVVWVVASPVINGNHLDALHTFQCSAIEDQNDGVADAASTTGVSTELLPTGAQIERISLVQLGLDVTPIRVGEFDGIVL